MVLQHMVWPESDRPDVTELYYHASQTLPVTEEGILEIPSEMCVRFDTYFNSFSGRQWTSYTIVKNVIFRIRVKGKGEVCLKREDGFCVSSFKFCGEEEFIVRLDQIEPVFYYLEIDAYEQVYLLEGVVETEDPGKEVKIALVTCTYNRQEAILFNINYLINKNSDSTDGGPVLEQIFVVDNASNLNPDNFVKERLSLIANRNTGGAGGFTRGMEEAMKHSDVTHILLMDDDVIIEFDALVRTRSVLRYLKEEYADSFIGGAMFRTDTSYILHAAGEGWDDGRVINPYKSSDMRSLSSVIKVSEPLTVEQPYAGWWYCCLPRKHVEKNGYPMPFFIHVDDIEYSLRSGRRPLYFNGIAVWHEEFEDKRSSVMEYYDVRNRLITNCLYKQSGRFFDAIYILCERFYSTVFRYRYKDFLIATKGAEDFLKGPEWLVRLDSEQYHIQLADVGYKMEVLNGDDVGKLPKMGEQRGALYAVCRYFLPAKGTITIRVGATVSAYAGKRNVLLVEPKSGKGLRVEKSWRMTGKCVLCLVKTVYKMAVNYRRVKKEWVLKKLWVTKRQ